MSQVERAIIMAAGKGTRMKPITNKVPKPLVKVNGKAMIEGVIEKLHEQGIKEIYVVVGYLKEQFNYLKEKYNDVHLIDNPYFDTCNNISSLYVAREHLKNVIILDGDQIINNSQILEKNFDFSGYNCIYKKEINNEWMLKIKEGLVTSCSRTGGTDGWQLYSVSRWNEEDGKRLKKHLEIEFEEKKNTEILTNNTLFLAKKDGKYGYVDKNNVVVVNYIYDDATEQNNSGYVAVKKDGKWGAINSKGETTVAPTLTLENNPVIDFIGTWHLAEDANANYYTK